MLLLAWAVLLLRGASAITYTEPSAAAADACRSNLGSDGWLALSPLPGPRLRLTINLSSPYRVGRDVLVEVQTESGALVTQGAALRQHEDLCASDDSRDGCTEVRLELSTLWAERVRPAFVGTAASELDESRIRVTIECVAGVRRMDFLSQQESGHNITLFAGAVAMTATSTGCSA